MKKSMNHRIAALPAPDAVAAAKKAIEKVSGFLPLTGGIPAEDRKTLAKINVGNKVFSDDALAAARGHAEALPPYIKVDDLQNRLESFVAYDDLIRDAEELVRKLKDTQVLIGSEAYTIALSIYYFFERACKDGVPGMETVCTQLGERFNGQSSRKGGRKGD